MKYIAKNGRIGFKAITPEDTDMVLGWRNSEFVRGYFIYKNPISKEEHLNWLRTKVDTGKVIQFVVYDIATDTPFGSVYFRDVDMESRQAEYGVFIGDLDYIGKGYGYEIAELMVKYGFENAGLDRIILRVFADNERAVKCYIKAGFAVCDRKQIVVENCDREVLFMEVLRG